MRKFPVVRVDWLDSTQWHRWRSLDTVVTELSLCTSVGFVIGETKDVLMLTADLNPEADHVGCVMSIPKFAIKKRRRLA